MSDFVSFNDFLQRTRSAQLALPNDTFANSAELERMRTHILSLYRDIKPVHSFIDEGGQYFDCFPADEQPGLRRPDGSMGKLASPPQPIPTPGTDRVPADAPPNMAEKPKEDEFGNRRECPTGSVPIRRLTLEAMARFRTMKDYF